MIAISPLLAVAAPAVNAEGWWQAAELALALVLSAAIGLEREIRQKNAGLRTHTLVGIGAALFMLVSKYGFTDVLESSPEGKLGPTARVQEAAILCSHAGTTRRSEVALTNVRSGTLTREMEATRRTRRVAFLL